MPVLTPTPAAAMPAWPNTSQTEEDFNAAADAVGVAMPPMVLAINAIAENVLNNAQYVEAQATAGLALASFKGAWSGLTGALNTPASVYHNGAYWVLLANLANVATDQPGVTANWALARLEVPAIPPIAASVAANALTVTINPTTLDFRSATLTSGAVSALSNAAAISMVVSSGSTLGTTSAVQSRVAVLAINNAGTMEVAVCNMYGANTLSEEGVITTVAEGGAGAADSADTIYSTTARTNVPYRLVGYIESTQTTAGTWAAAPTKIQGKGGAVGLYNSIGQGQKFQSVSRTTGTNYIAPLDRPIAFYVYGVTSAPNGAIQITAGGIQLSGATQPNNASGLACWALIPPGATYQFVATSITVNTTYELR